MRRKGLTLSSRLAYAMLRELDKNARRAGLVHEDGTTHHRCSFVDLAEAAGLTPSSIAVGIRDLQKIGVLYLENGSNSFNHIIHFPPKGKRFDEHKNLVNIESEE